MPGFAVDIINFAPTFNVGALPLLGIGTSVLRTIAL